MADLSDSEVVNLEGFHQSEKGISKIKMQLQLRNKYKLQPLLV